MNDIVLLKTLISNSLYNTPQYKFFPPPPNNIITIIKNKPFLEILYSLFPVDKRLTILDLGCGNGGLICDIIKDRHIGIGVDITREYTTSIKQVGWNWYPNNFFVMDISQAYEFYYRMERVYFDVILSSEMFEHLKEEEVNRTIYYMSRNLSNNGLAIHQISFLPMHGHRTIQNKHWWINKFKQYGFEEFINPFGKICIREDCKDISHMLCFRRS